MNVSKCHISATPAKKIVFLNQMSNNIGDHCILSDLWTSANDPHLIYYTYNDEEIDCIGYMNINKPDRHSCVHIDILCTDEYITNDDVMELAKSAPVKDCYAITMTISYSSLDYAFAHGFSVFGRYDPYNRVIDIGYIVDNEEREKFTQLHMLRDMQVYAISKDFAMNGMPSAFSKCYVYSIGTAENPEYKITSTPTQDTPEFALLVNKHDVEDFTLSGEEASIIPVYTNYILRRKKEKSKK